MESKHPWVILFDIDGTLLTVKHHFNRPLIRKVVAELNIDYDGVESDSFSGRTDHDIFNSFLVNHHYDKELYFDLKSAYLERLNDELTDEVIIRHPHVDDVINYFNDSNAILGLLTGNYPAAAQTKLANGNIQLEHSIGAFGEFHSDRNKLPQLALDQFESLTKQVPEPQRFIIIGDTPKDIECAKYAGMKVVAVTTGNYSKKDLLVYQPDMVLDSLKNPEQWFSELTE